MSSAESASRERLAGFCALGVVPVGGACVGRVLGVCDPPGLAAGNGEAAGAGEGDIPGVGGSLARVPPNGGLPKTFTGADPWDAIAYRCR